MPNHVTTILTVSGDDTQKQAMFEAIKNDKIGLGSFDFSKIIPAPENIYQGNLGQAEREKYGKDNWYDWNIAHWGTKWNCYGFHDYTEKDFDGSTIEFQTAWSHPTPILVALAEQYPDLHFEVMWADEDFGHNVGKKEYQNLIDKNEEWELVDIYADEAVTGTRTDKREEFMRMLVDCRKGKIDLILVKSVSRFARNIHDCLSTVRVLKTLGVEVEFEEDGLKTADMHDEMIIGAFSSIAQEESTSISNNMRWSYARRMQKGSFWYLIAFGRKGTWTLLFLCRKPTRSTSSLNF